MKLAITGASGFIGRHFMRRYQHEFSSVSILCRQPRTAENNVRFVLGDLSDAAVLAKLCQGADVVLHCAFDGSYTSNQSAIRHLLHACQVHRVSRLVHLSSYVVYDFQAHSISESTPYSTRKDLYTREKIAIERSLRTCSNRDISIVMLQPTVVFGLGSAWSNSMFTAVKHNQIFLPNAGDNLCNAVFIDDLVDVIWNELDAPMQNSIQARLVSNIQTTWRSLLAFHANSLRQFKNPVGEYTLRSTSSRLFAESFLKNFVLENSGTFPLRQLITLTRRRERKTRNRTLDLASPSIDMPYWFSGTARMCQSFSHRVEPHKSMPPRVLEDQISFFSSPL